VLNLDYTFQSPYLLYFKPLSLRASACDLYDSLDFESCDVHASFSTSTIEQAASANYFSASSLCYLQILSRCLSFATSARDLMLDGKLAYLHTYTLTEHNLSLARSPLSPFAILPCGDLAATATGIWRFAMRSQGIDARNIQAWKMYKDAYLEGLHLSLPKYASRSGLVSQSRIHYGCGLAVADSAGLHTAAAPCPNHVW
jgi:hypothetical protein